MEVVFLTLFQDGLRHTSNMVLKYLSNTGSNTRPTADCRSKIIQGRIVHSKSLKHLEILPRATLGVRQDGSIAFLRDDDDLEALQTEPAFQNAEVIKLRRSQFLFPGMVDTHLHAPQWPNLALGMDGDLREWVEDWTDPIEVGRDRHLLARLQADGS